MGADKYQASGKTDYETPQELFEEWDKVFQFNLDACATAKNAKIKWSYITPEEDAFKTDWLGRFVDNNDISVLKLGRVFCNPPYGKGIDLWIQRAIDQVTCGNAEFVLMLLPANTDTKWFHNLCKRGRIRFLPGWIKFGGAKWNNKNGSMLVLFGEDPSNWKWDIISDQWDIVSGCPF